MRVIDGGSISGKAEEYIFPVFLLLSLVVSIKPAIAETSSGGESGVLTLGVNVPQTITVNATASSYEELQEIIFTVVTNNGFDLSFSGVSPLENGVGENPWPQFSKQDEDVLGNPVADQYDLLSTQFGVVVVGHSSVEFLDQWGGGAIPAGTPQDLVLPLDQISAAVGGPDEAIGRIMPGAGDQAEVHLYVQATSSLQHQPGVYTMMLTGTVVANPE